MIGHAGRSRRKLAVSASAIKTSVKRVVAGQFNPASSSGGNVIRQPRRPPMDVATTSRLDMPQVLCVAGQYGDRRFGTDGNPGRARSGDGSGRTVKVRRG